MSDIPLSHICFQNVYAGHDEEEFWFEMKGGRFGYWYKYPNGLTRWNDWDISLEYLEQNLYGYRSIRKIPTMFHGPMQPPPSPLILKIREMEKRRQVAYA